MKRTTKKNFIKLLTTKKSVFLGSYLEFKDSRLDELFEHFTHYIDNKELYFPDNAFRVVEKVQSNGLMFNNGSWLYFDAFSKYYQYKNIIISVHTENKHIHNKYDDVEYNLHDILVYYLDDVESLETKIDNTPIDKRINRVKKFLDNKFSNVKGRECLKYSSTAVIIDTCNVPITYQVFTDSWIAFYLKTPLNLPVVPDNLDYPDLSRMINFNNYEMSVPFNLSIKECLNAAKLKGDDVYIPLYDDRCVDSRKIKTVISILDTKDLTIYKPKYDNKRPLVLVANNGDFAIVSTCKKVVLNGN